MFIAVKHLILYYVVVTFCGGQVKKFSHYMVHGLKLQVIVMNKLYSGSLLLLGCFL